ncbi:hypothetical protein CEXT_110841 [Caerostris extrusa]|uniref:Uncharacterized protein n=1 Tax=Caerostris extrusa TaxID=172846 RepID=A0AAV4Q2D7_CAEEX|nr:hypothetical protein CEXT_110841 [Caerostris extrusa]
MSVKRFIVFCSCDLFMKLAYSDNAVCVSPPQSRVQNPKTNRLVFNEEGETSWHTPELLTYITDFQMMRENGTVTARGGMLQGCGCK